MARLKTLPPSGTAAARVLAKLLVGERIGPAEAWAQLGIYRLSEAIRVLRRECGWPVAMELIPTANKFGEPVRYGRYGLTSETLGEVDEAAAVFARRELEALAELVGAEHSGAAWKRLIPGVFAE